MNAATPNTLGPGPAWFLRRSSPAGTWSKSQPSRATVIRSSCCCGSSPHNDATSVTELDLEDLGPQVVLDFLHHLEVERHNVPATRNVRLAAIHAFFRYCAAEHPDRMGSVSASWRFLSSARGSRPVEYLEFD